MLITTEVKILYLLKKNNLHFFHNNSESYYPKKLDGLYNLTFLVLYNLSIEFN